MANIFLGTAINWGVTGTAITGTGVGTLTVQDFDFEPTADVDETRDETGNLIQETYYNPGQKAQFDYVVKGSGLADAITQSTVPAPGTIITVATCTQNPVLNSTTWRVKESPTIKHSNKNKAMVTLKLVKHAGVTAVTGA